MNKKISKHIFTGVMLLIVILLFTDFDYLTHSLNAYWSVPDYYFRNKIPFGFLWGIVGLFAASRVEAVWLKALTVSGIIAVMLQIRYFIEGYPLSFVFSFLFFHFTILYVLSHFMFLVLRRYNQ